MQAIVDRYGSALPGARLLGHQFLALHGAENHPFHRHELLPDKTLAATGAQEAFCGRVPAEAIVGHSLHFRVDGVVAALTHLFGDKVSRRRLETDRVSHAGTRGQTEPESADGQFEKDVKNRQVTAASSGITEASRDLYMPSRVRSSR